VRLNNFRIKPRLVGAFLAMAAIAAVVGLVGLAQLREVASVRLPSVAGLKEMQGAQQALLAIQRGLINQRLIDSTARERLWNKRRQWLEQAKKGRELYEPLPQTKEEAAIWQEFKPVWEQWLEADERLAAIQREKDALLQRGR
jgi:methyl-accepting chemotaxis protein